PARPWPPQAGSAAPVLPAPAARLRRRRPQTGTPFACRPRSPASPPSAPPPRRPPSARHAPPACPRSPRRSKPHPTSSRHVRRPQGRQDPSFRDRHPSRALRPGYPQVRVPSTWRPRHAALASGVRAQTGVHLTRCFIPSMTYAPRLIDYKRLPPRLVAALQAEVARLRGGTRRRTVEYTVALFPLDPTGVPLLEHRVPVASWPAGAMPGRGRPVLDHALRVDLLLAALPPAAAPGWDADRDAALVISRPGV